MNYSKRTPTPKPTASNSTRPSAYQISQQKRVLRRFLQEVGFQSDEIERSIEKTTLYNLWVKLAVSPAKIAQLKRWLLEWLDWLLRLVKQFRAPKRLSRREWLALAMVAGLTASSLSQPLLIWAGGETPLGSEFRVNTYTTSDQRFPSVGMDGDGDFVITWESYGQNDDGAGIYAQRYNAAGTPQGSEFRVNSYTTDAQNNPSVTLDADGDFVVAWQSFGQDGSGWGIYARRYNASGTPQGSEFQVNSYTTSHQHNPSVGVDADGDFVITWTSYLQDGTSGGIYARRYNANGTPQGSEFQVNSYTDSGQSTSVTLDADGDFVVAWQSFGQDGSSWGIYARRYNASGTPQGSEFQVNSYTTSHQSTPSVGVDANGDFVITWNSSGQDGKSGGIYARRYNASGITQDISEFRVNTTTTNFHAFPSVGVDADGDFVIVWTSYLQDGSGYGIYAQRYNANGTPQGSEFQVNSHTTYSQRYPSVGMDQDGDFAIAWQDGPTLYYGGSGGQDGDDNGVFAQRYGTFPAPEITIAGQGQEITDGDDTPITSDDTDFGNAVAGSGTVQRTFTISNSGLAELTLGTVAITGTHASDFSVSQQPISPVMASGVTTFTVQFAPSATGIRMAEVSLSNNDEGENPYNFAIQGTGVVEEGASAYLPLIIKS